MMKIAEVLEWLTEQNPDYGVAVDDGGLILIVLDNKTKQTGAYCEVGGIPLDEED